MRRTNIDIDEKLLREAMTLTGMGTKKSIVNYALSELVRRMKRKKMLDLEGKIKWSGSLSKMRHAALIIHARWLRAIHCRPEKSLRWCYSKQNPSHH